MTNLSKLNKDLQKLLDKNTAMIIADAENSLMVNIRTLKYLCNKRDMPGIYITVNRPYQAIHRILLDNKVNLDKLFFIDCITTAVGSEPRREERCLFVSPTDLTDLAVSVDEWIETMPEKEKFLFMDSLSTLLFYNSVGTIAKFSHFLTDRMKLWNLTGIFMSLESESDPHLLDDISQFCDGVITIKKRKKKNDKFRRVTEGS